MKILIGIQARSQSTRLPQKIFKKIGDKDLIEWVHNACVEAERRLRVDGLNCETWVLGPHADKELIEYCERKEWKLKTPHCNDDDLITRYKKVLEAEGFTHLVRVTSDCWQMNPEIIMEAVHLMDKEKADYVSNTIHRSFIEGLDIQACSSHGLNWFDKFQSLKREHPFCLFDKNEAIRESFETRGFKYMEMINPRAEWLIRTSIDTESDILMANKIYEKAIKRKNGNG